MGEGEEKEVKRGEEGRKSQEEGRRRAVSFTFLFDQKKLSLCLLLLMMLTMLKFVDT